MEEKLNELKADNERLKDIIKDYNCCCAENESAELDALKQALEDANAEREHLHLMVQHLLQTREFFNNGLSAAIDAKYGENRPEAATRFIESINGVKRLAHRFEME